MVRWLFICFSVVPSFAHDTFTKAEAIGLVLDGYFLLHTVESSRDNSQDNVQGQLKTDESMTFSVEAFVEDMIRKVD